MAFNTYKIKIIKNFILKFIANKLEKLIYLKSKSIVALSPDMKKGIKTKNIHSKYIAVVPNGGQ